MTNDIPQFAISNKYKLANILEDSEDPIWTDRVEDVPAYRANLISSEATQTSNGLFVEYMAHDKHRPLLDLDMDAALLPSSTPGHWHLYIDKVMPWPDYEKLLKTLFEVGIIQRGVYDNAVKRKFTSLRLPGIDKYDHKANNPFPPDNSDNESYLDRTRRLEREIAEKQAELADLQMPF